MSKNKIITLVVLVVFIGAVAWLVTAPAKAGKYDGLAMCIKDKGALFYGAFWCPHCQNQKAMFGRSARLLPYIECSTPDGKGQLKNCTDVGVKSYPTWVFPDGTTETGEIEPADLAAKVGCAMPE